ncbi:hypothetical protein cypCar_00018025 [Cyprinus carpio]|nr:hypothetical protein cypCar_00018025 [Cyprinus carpio]
MGTHYYEDFFQICDSEGKGFITRTDMRRLHKKLPLTTEELESVFDSLDLDKNGYLTLGEFSSGFSNFLHGQRISMTEELMTAPSQKAPEALDQSSGDEQLSENEDDEERHFSMMMESLGVSNVFEETLKICSRADKTYSITEGLQREKQSLIKQMDLLREVDKEEVTQRSNRKTSSLANGLCSPFTAEDDGKPEVDGHSEKVAGDSESVNVVVDVEDVPLDGWPLRRVISIKEDHLPHLLQGDPYLLLHQLSEEEEVQGKEEGQANLETSSLYPSNASLASADSPPPVRVKKPSKKKWIKGNIPSSARGQPVGKETLQQASITSYAKMLNIITKCLHVEILKRQ